MEQIHNTGDNPFKVLEVKEKEEVAMNYEILEFDLICAALYRSISEQEAHVKFVKHDIEAERRRLETFKTFQLNVTNQEKKFNTFIGKFQDMQLNDIVKYQKIQMSRQVEEQNKFLFDLECKSNDYEQRFEKLKMVQEIRLSLNEIEDYNGQLVIIMQDIAGIHRRIQELKNEDWEYTKRFLVYCSEFYVWKSDAIIKLNERTTLQLAENVKRMAVESEIAKYELDIADLQNKISELSKMKISNNNANMIIINRFALQAAMECDNETMSNVVKEEKMAQKRKLPLSSYVSTKLKKVSSFERLDGFDEAPVMASVKGPITLADSFVKHEHKQIKMSDAKQITILNQIIIPAKNSVSKVAQPTELTNEDDDDTEMLFDMHSTVLNQKQNVSTEFNYGKAQSVSQDFEEVHRKIDDFKNESDIMHSKENITYDISDSVFEDQAPISTKKIENNFSQSQFSQEIMHARDTRCANATKFNKKDTSCKESDLILSESQKASKDTVYIEERDFNISNLSEISTVSSFTDEKEDRQTESKVKLKNNNKSESTAVQSEIQKSYKCSETEAKNSDNKKRAGRESDMTDSYNLMLDSAPNGLLKDTPASESTILETSAQIEFLDMSTLFKDSESPNNTIDKDDSLNFFANFGGDNNENIENFDMEDSGTELEVNKSFGFF